MQCILKIGRPTFIKISKQSIFRAFSAPKSKQKLTVGNFDQSQLFQLWE